MKRRKNMLKATLSFIYLMCLCFVSSWRCKENTKCAIGYTHSMQNRLLSYLNNIRSNVKPTARNMEKVYWDDTLADMAYKFAARCKFKHNPPSERRYAGYNYVGQNLFRSQDKPDALTATRAWFNEVKGFTFGKKTSKTVGHYTQLVRGPLARLGCAMSQCPTRGRTLYMVVCHYIIGQWNFHTPYERGPSCAKCPNKCQNNLCDCQGISCQNGGDLDLNTCKCKCHGLSRGKFCEKFDCVSKKRGYCTYVERYCDPKYGNRARYMCPINCGVCK